MSDDSVKTTTECPRAVNGRCSCHYQEVTSIVEDHSEEWPSIGIPLVEPVLTGRSGPSKKVIFDDDKSEVLFEDGQVVRLDRLEFGVVKQLATMSEDTIGIQLTHNDIFYWETAKEALRRKGVDPSEIGYVDGLIGYSARPTVEIYHGNMLEIE